MKITDYPSVTELAENDTFLVDGPDGTRQITAKDLSSAMFSGGDESKDIFDILDKSFKGPARRMLWRGKNLGGAVTDKQYDQIGSGDFQGLFLGDYWEIDGRIWRIVDFDYWLGTGDVECTTHHLVIMPDRQLYTEKMNATDVTTGAYVNSVMYKTGLTNAKTVVDGAFMTAHILDHREYLQNATTSGYASAGAWMGSTVELPNEVMMYGSYIFTPAGSGAIVVSRQTVNKGQLAGMMANPMLISPHRENQWLRDVVSATSFARLNLSGIADSLGASNAAGVRPVFGICKENEG